MVEKAITAISQSQPYIEQNRQPFTALVSVRVTSPLIYSFYQLLVTEVNTRFKGVLISNCNTATHTFQIMSLTFI